MKNLLKINDTIGIISCSNGLDIKNKENIDNLIKKLNSININVKLSDSIYVSSNNLTINPKIRAKELHKLYKDDKVKAIFDISGGDLCNEVLEYLDFDLIEKNHKPFFGYSDLTVILNALYSKTNTINYNYQLRNLIREDNINQLNNFNESLINSKFNLYDFKYKFIRGNKMDGIIIGGNIRCFLKLSGTEYMPSFDDKILFLEALGGDYNKISTFLAQYKQLGAFNKIKGLLLGTFTELSKTSILIDDLILEKLSEFSFPIAKTSEIGHDANSKCLPIGKYIILDDTN